MFLGIVSMKLGIVPQHNPDFSVDRPSYSRPVYRRFLALHLRNDVAAIAEIWNDQIAYMVELGELTPDVASNLTAVFPPPPSGYSSSGDNGVLTNTVRFLYSATLDAPA